MLFNRATDSSDKAAAFISDMSISKRDFPSEKTSLPGTVVVIAIPENKIIDTITVENAPTDVAVTRNGQHVYVTNEGSGTVSVISAATDKVEATIPGFHAPSPVATQPPRHRPFRNRDHHRDDQD